MDAAERGIRFITRMEQQLMDRARRQPVAQVPGFAEVSEGLYRQDRAWVVLPCMMLTQ